MPKTGRAAMVPYASDPGATRGRLHDEPASPTRTVFQRDRDRVVHANAFRRLKDKTQVFLFDEGDHYRTRLTHTLEVAQIARSIARSLALDEDLAEALALAHDLGHPPFGHAGERALDAEMTDHGGFDHNAQSLRVVTTLERRYPAFDGLNLTWETLEGLVKHNGPLIGAGADAAALPFAVADYNARMNLELASYPGPEAQIAAVSDDIAYNAHDIDDGLRAGLLDLESLSEVPLAGGLLGAIVADYPHLAPERTRAELIRRLISAMINDVVTETSRRLEVLAPADVTDIRGAESPVVAFSGDMALAETAIKNVLVAQVYRHPRVMAVMSAAEKLLRALFQYFLFDPASMPRSWRDGESADIGPKVRRTADFVAGMSDRYAIGEYRRLIGEPDLGSVGLHGFN
ncbi:MAG: deoxyguanosinetriphosphate triphosphohydrolase [Alphaproteobacteria bacterium]